MFIRKFYPIRLVFIGCCMLVQRAIAREWLNSDNRNAGKPKSFQYRAARRRLIFAYQCNICRRAVSTHSRPKAAEAPLESLVPSALKSPISPTPSKKVGNKYNTADNRYTCFLKFLIVKENLKIANLPAFP